MAPTTLFEKIWESHVVRAEPDGTTLLYIDRQLVHEVTSPQAFEGLRLAGRKPRRPGATLAVPDHNVPTTDRSVAIADPVSAKQIQTLEDNCREYGITMFGMNDVRQGIVQSSDRSKASPSRGPRSCAEILTRPHTARSARWPSASGRAKWSMCWPRNADSETAHEHGDPCRWHARRSLFGKRRHSGHHRQNRNGRRHRVCDRIHRLSDSQP